MYLNLERSEIVSNERSESNGQRESRFTVVFRVVFRFSSSFSRSSLALVSRLFFVQFLFISFRSDMLSYRGKLKAHNTWIHRRTGFVCSVYVSSWAKPSFATEVTYNHNKAREFLFNNKTELLKMIISGLFLKSKTFWKRTSRMNNRCDNFQLYNIWNVKSAITWYLVYLITH